MQMYFSGNKNILNRVIIFSMSSSFSGSSIVAVICGIEAILGSLSPLVSGDAFNMEDNNSFMYSQFYSSDIFFSTRFCNFFFFLLKNLYLRSPSFVVI